MFAITTIVSENPTSYELYDGLFFKPAVEMISNQRVNKYISDRKTGWTEVDFGYYRYCLQDTDGTLYIIPGIHLNDFPPKKILSKRLYKFSKLEIENYAKEIILFVEKTKQEAERDLNMLVHDLRNISAAIYNSAISASSALKRDDLSSAQQEIDSVIASQAMLKMRTDVIDYIGNPTSIVEIRDIPIYRRFDKVSRAFSSKAFNHGLNIILTGESYNITKGPDILEIVPYIFVDNAIKYSPKKSMIDIHIEDKSQETQIVFKSLGPKIDNTEKFTIFERGYRGIHALESARPGSGVGLNLARHLVENHFGGTITVHQSESAEEREGELFYWTEFIILIPSRDGQD